MKKELQKYVNELKVEYDFYSEVESQYNRGVRATMISIIGGLVKRFDLENPFIKELEEENK